MRLKSPRIAPVIHPTEAQSAALEGLPPLNIFRTLVHAPKALAGFLAWGNYVLSRRNNLPPREREIVILRIGYLCRSGYEFTQHTRIGQRDGLNLDEINRIKQGADAAGWGAADQALIRAADELHADQFISEPTWQALSAHFDEKQRMDVVFTAGQYTQVSMMLNTFGIQLEPGETLDPDLAAY
jgi:alkylhydroperoxidase family enzyme